MTFNILHISHFDNRGGSGRAAYRLHQGLKQLGVRSRMLVDQRATADEDVRRINQTGLLLLDRICNQITQQLSLEYLFYPSTFLLSRQQWFREADVIQLYNIHGGYFSYPALPYLSRHHPIVWRLSDMWALTGHCIYSYECERWQSGCGACPHLNDPPYPLRKDRTALLWRIKDWVYRHSRLTIVSPSHWLAKLAQVSPLLKRFPIHIIPNGLDTTVFRPIPKVTAREVLGLDAVTPVLLFSAQMATETRKGGSLLKISLETLAQMGIENLTLLIMGSNGQHLDLPACFSQKYLGFVQDDLLMATVYSAADIFVFPTLAENLPNGILESMACGTPAVAFDVGGVPEAVRPMETGYLAKYKDTNDLAQGIRLLLTEVDLRLRLSQCCREVVEQEYSLQLQAQRFLDLYTGIISGGREVGNARAQ